MTELQLYVAVLPPAEVIHLIDELPTKAQRGVRYTKRDQWHITLKFLGLTEPNAALAALEGVDASEAEVHLGPEVSLLGPRVVMIPATGLDGLAATTAAAFAGVGEPQPERDFEGHLTLARLKGAPLRDPAIVPVLGAPISTSFQARSIVLVQTEVTPEGTQRTVIGERDLAS